MGDAVEEVVVKLLRRILSSEEISQRVTIVSSAIDTLTALKETNPENKNIDEYIKAFEEVKQHIGLHIYKDSLSVLELLKKYFPESIIKKLTEEMDIFISQLVEKVKVKYYGSGVILIIIPLPDKPPHEIRIKRESIHKIFESLASGKVKPIVTPDLLRSIAKVYGYNKDIDNSFVVRFNLKLIEKVQEAYNNPLPFKNEDEEYSFEEFKRDLAEHEYVFDWDDVKKFADIGEFLESAKLTPEEVIFLRNNKAYIPTKLINRYIKTRRFSNIIIKLTNYYADVFKTSFIYLGKKIDIRYLVLPLSLLKSHLGIKLEPRDPEEYISAEKKEEEDIEKGFEQLEQQKDDRQH